MLCMLYPMLRCAALAQAVQWVHSIGHDRGVPSVPVVQRVHEARAQRVMQPPLETLRMAARQVLRGVLSHRRQQAAQQALVPYMYCRYC